AAPGPPRRVRYGFPGRKVLAKREQYDDHRQQTAEIAEEARPGRRSQRRPQAAVQDLLGGDADARADGERVKVDGLHVGPLMLIGRYYVPSHANCKNDGTRPPARSLPRRGYDTRPGHDQETAIRRIPALFAQGQSEDRQAPKSRHLQIARRGRKARAGRAIFQAALNPVVLVRHAASCACMTAKCWAATRLSP